MLKFYQADVFTGLPFGGNPVAVFPEAQDLTDYQLQQIAREMNLSETVFVLPPTDQAAVVRLRIFTPIQEIPFAGHPVLGTFYVLAQLGLIAVTDGVTRVMQECNIGLFPVEIHAREGQVTRVVMTQPKPQFLGSVDEPEDLFDIAKALGLSIHQIVDTKKPVMVVSTGLPVVIVPVRTLTAVRSIVPDAAAIIEVCERVGTNGIMVFTTMTVRTMRRCIRECLRPRSESSKIPPRVALAGPWAPISSTMGWLKWGPLQSSSSSRAMKSGVRHAFLSRSNPTTMPFRR